MQSLPRGTYCAHDGLAAGMNMHVLDGHLLLAFPAMPIQGFQQHGKASGELVGLVQVLSAPLEGLLANLGVVAAGTVPQDAASYMKLAPGLSPRVPGCVAQTA